MRGRLARADRAGPGRPVRYPDHRVGHLLVHQRLRCRRVRRDAGVERDTRAARHRDRAVRRPALIVSVVALALLIGIYWVAYGIAQIYAAIAHRELPHRGWMGFIG